MKSLKKIGLILLMGASVNVAFAGGCGCGSSQLTIDAVHQAESLKPRVMQASGWFNTSSPYEQARRNLDVMLISYASAFNTDYAAYTVVERAQHYRLLDNLRLARIRHVEGLAELVASKKHDVRAVDVLLAHAQSLKFTPDERRGLLAHGRVWMAKAEASVDLPLQQAAKRVREGCTKLGTPDLALCFNNAIAQADSLAAGHLTTYAWPSGPLTQLVARANQLDQGKPALVQSLQLAKH
jgi:hypothetical protein